MKKRVGLVLLFLLLFGSSLVAFAFIPERDENFAVTDLAGLFSDNTVNYLINQNNQLFDANGGEVVFLTIDRIPNRQTIADFSTDVFNTWGVGSVENNNGILIVIANLEGEAYVTIGGGLEAHMTNDYLNHVMETYFTPYFAEGNDDLAATQIFDVLSNRIYEIFSSGTTLVQDSQDGGLMNFINGRGGLMNLITDNWVMILIVILILFLLFSSPRRSFRGERWGRGFGRRRMGGGAGTFAGGFLLGKMLGRRNQNRNTYTQSRPTTNTRYTRNTPRASTNRGASSSVNPRTRRQSRSSYSTRGSGGYSRGGTTRRRGR